MRIFYQDAHFLLLIRKLFNTAHTQLFRNFATEYFFKEKKSCQN